MPGSGVGLTGINCGLTQAAPCINTNQNSPTAASRYHGETTAVLRLLPWRRRGETKGSKRRVFGG